MTTANNPDVSALVSALTPKLPVSVDAKGRMRVSKEQRRLILAEFERSGVSAARFARQTGMTYSTFAGWVQRYRASKRRRKTRSVRLLEALVESPPRTATLLVHLPGHARIEITAVEQAGLAAALLRALEKPC